MKNFSHTVALWILALGCTPAFSQSSAVLEKYIQTGISNNLNLQQSDLELARSAEQIRQAKALFYPQFQFEANYTLAAGGRKLDFPIGDLLNPVYSTLNQLTQSQAFPQVENAQINFLPNNFHETKITFAYPLYNSDLKYNRKIKESMLQGNQSLKSAQMADIAYEITQTYILYLQSREAEKIWVNTRSVLQELRRFNEALVKNNVATRDVVASAEYELSKAENEIVQYQSKQRNAAAYLNMLIGFDLQTPVEVDTGLLRAPVGAYVLADLIQQAPQRRQELVALSGFESAAGLNAERQAAQQKYPTLYLGGALGFQGFGYTFSKEQAYALAQVGLRYNLYHGGMANSQTQEARLGQLISKNQTQQVELQISMQITAAYNEFEAARFAFESASKNVVSAQSVFKIINNKYKAGQALLLEWMDAQNRVTVAQLQQLLSWTTVILKESALKQAAGLPR